jgi:hypothetical protein
MLNGGCILLSGAIAATGVGAPYAPAVLAGCIAVFEATTIACGLAKTGPVCAAVSNVINLFDPDGARISVTVSGPKIPTTEQVREVPGLIGDVTFDFDLNGSASVESFSTSPVDPGPGQGYVASAALTCVGATSSISLSISGTDGYTDSTSCSAGASTCNLTVPGAAEGVVDTISVIVGGLVLRTIQLVF